MDKPSNFIILNKVYDDNDYTLFDMFVDINRLYDHQYNPLAKLLKRKPDQKGKFKLTIEYTEHLDDRSA